MTDLETLSLKLYTGFKNKYPELDPNHFTPTIIGNLISKSKINYQSEDGVRKIIGLINQNLNYFRKKINKERQQKGLLDFSLDTQTKVQRNGSQAQPVSNLVRYSKPIKPTYDNSRREFRGQSLIVDPSGKVNNKRQKIPLNHLESHNLEHSNSKSFPDYSDGLDGISSLRDIEPEINQNDRFILDNSQRKMITEENGEWVYYLVIDSKDRNYDVHQSPNSYTIGFSPPSFNSSDVRPGYIDQSFNNVKSIELVKCFFLDTSSQDDASDYSAPPPYVLLEIEEFTTQFHGTNQYLNRSMLILDQFTTQGSYKYYNVLYSDVGVVTKFNPRITLDRISVKFRLPNGDLYNFGEENDNNTNTVNLLVFKITVMKKNLETNFFNQTA